MKLKVLKVKIVRRVLKHRICVFRVVYIVGYSSIDDVLIAQWEEVRLLVVSVPFHYIGYLCWFNSTRQIYVA